MCELGALQAENPGIGRASGDGPVSPVVPVVIVVVVGNSQPPV